jgi:NADPH-dependent glutamate synthase beta subunit-like oxidoreductase
MDFLRPDNLLRFGYKDCLLCEVERKGEERRCRRCSGRQEQRDRLLWEIRGRQLRRKAATLSYLYPGLGHLFAGRVVLGLFWASLIPLALGLAVNTWSGPSMKESAAVLRGDAETRGKMVMAAGDLLRKVPGGIELAKAAGAPLATGEEGAAPAGGGPDKAGEQPPGAEGGKAATAAAAEEVEVAPAEALPPEELGRKLSFFQASVLLSLLVWQSTSYGHIFLLVSFCFIYWISLQDAKRGTNERLAPCEAACPSGVRIPDYIALIREGMPLEALALVHDRLPFAAFCGRACPHPCEQHCVRNEWQAPISIMSLKRYAADLGYSERVVPPPGGGDPNPPKVAVVGAGPAGLSAASTLAKLGARPVVFDENEEPGGTMRYGVVDFRYPVEALEDDVRGILARGAVFEGGKRAGVDFSLASLASQGFDAVLVATGTTSAFRLPGAGTEEEGFLDALTFLSRAARKVQPRLRGKVVVVGGGNVAMDVARTALRLGAEDLTVLCLESRETMPAFAWEVDDAEEEGAKLLPSAAVKRFIFEDGRLAALEVLKVERIDFDAKKRIVPVTVAGSEYEVRADLVIMAIGSRADLSFLPEQSGRTVLDAKRHVYRLQFGGNDLTIPVYACGDCVRGPATVVEASASGREAALNIYGDLRVEEVVKARYRDNYRRRNEPQVSDSPGWRVRRHPERIAPEAARESFEEVERRFTEESARHEAERCARCNLCL